ncbi:GNAT family N-acetyltransferase [Petroclostridium sp. X23]|uniref:GNAT family N-acetyltransferase n=1 Tax=Petroclostridium sp. X23 TaxID=3045146 RepID=UPI0024AE0611|nr:GNAT family N-acetyltransferase [Petroclostridium sp. X23]WHH59482.1 GNAT family N-acetyltransferase [Petroclostridium sp. X23]
MKINMWTQKRNSINTKEFIYLFSLVGWGELPYEQAEKALENSLCTFAVYSAEKVIAVARLCGDRAMSFYIKDLIVHPDFQRKGIGTLIIQDIKKYIIEQIPEGWYVSLELISAKGKERFYEKQGFDLRPTTEDGAGMYLIMKI